MKAVVLFNLGGPDKLESVKPFLFNLFYDPYIVGLPNPFRYALAKLISSRREKEAKEIYQHLGGKSPILSQTEQQAKTLEAELGDDYKVYVAMRYWKPMCRVIVQELIAKNFEELILVPLYPQYSTTTTESFYSHWDNEAANLGLTTSVRKICCYPTNKEFIEAHVALIKGAYPKAQDISNTRFLFSAHGLPEKIILRGDPYQQHIEASVQTIIESLPQIQDYAICYQSRVGPLKWIGPSTEKELERAGKDKVPVAIVPISFVSEHSETLYELDYLYKRKAENVGIPNYTRIPALQDSNFYIMALRSLVTSHEMTPCGVPLCKLKCVRKELAA